MVKNTKEHILDVGHKLVVKNGFIATGLSELLSEADVPKGSFYHFFKSKEDFGVHLLKKYFDDYLFVTSGFLQNRDKTGYDRVIDYFSYWLEKKDGNCSAYNCLVTKLSAEVSDLSENMREEMLIGVKEVINELNQCIKEGLEDKSIHIYKDTHLFAQEIYQQWIGAALLGKVYKDTEARLSSCMVLTKHLLGKEE